MGQKSSKSPKIKQPSSPKDIKKIVGITRQVLLKYNIPQKQANEYLSEFPKRSDINFAFEFLHDRDFARLEPLFNIHLLPSSSVMPTSSVPKNDLSFSNLTPSNIDQLNTNDTAITSHTPQDLGLFDLDWENIWKFTLLRYIYHRILTDDLFYWANEGLRKMMGVLPKLDSWKNCSDNFSTENFRRTFSFTSFPNIHSNLPLFRWEPISFINDIIEHYQYPTLHTNELPWSDVTQFISTLTQHEPQLTSYFNSLFASDKGELSPDEICIDRNNIEAVLEDCKKFLQSQESTQKSTQDPTQNGSSHSTTTFDTTNNAVCYIRLLFQFAFCLYDFTLAAHLIKLFPQYMIPQVNNNTLVNKQQPKNNNDNDISNDGQLTMAEYSHFVVRVKINPESEFYLPPILNLEFIHHEEKVSQHYLCMTPLARLITCCEDESPQLISKVLNSLGPLLNKTVFLSPTASGQQWSYEKYYSNLANWKYPDGQKPTFPSQELTQIASRLDTIISSFYTLRDTTLKSLSHTPVSILAYHSLGQSHRSYPAMLNGTANIFASGIESIQNLLPGVKSKFANTYTVLYPFGTMISSTTLTKSQFASLIKRPGNHEISLELLISMMNVLIHGQFVAMYSKLYPKTHIAPFTYFPHHTDHFTTYAHLVAKLPYSVVFNQVRSFFALQHDRTRLFLGIVLGDVLDKIKSLSIKKLFEINNRYPTTICTATPTLEEISEMVKRGISADDGFDLKSFLSFFFLTFTPSIPISFFTTTLQSKTLNNSSIDSPIFYNQESFILSNHYFNNIGVDKNDEMMPFISDSPDPKNFPDYVKNGSNVTLNAMVITLRVLVLGIFNRIDFDTLEVPNVVTYLDNVLRSFLYIFSSSCRPSNRTLSQLMSTFNSNLLKYRHTDFTQANTPENKSKGVQILENFSCQVPIGHNTITMQSSNYADNLSGVINQYKLYTNNSDQTDKTFLPTNYVISITNPTIHPSFVTPEMVSPKVGEVTKWPGTFNPSTIDSTKFDFNGISTITNNFLPSVVIGKTTSTGDDDDKEDKPITEKQIDFYHRSSLHTSDLPANELYPHYRYLQYLSHPLLYPTMPFTLQDFSLIQRMTNFSSFAPLVTLLSKSYPLMLTPFFPKFTSFAQEQKPILKPYCNNLYDDHNIKLYRYINTIFQLMISTNSTPSFYTHSQLTHIAHRLPAQSNQFPRQYRMAIPHIPAASAAQPSSKRLQPFFYDEFTPISQIDLFIPSYLGSTPISNPYSGLTALATHRYQLPSLQKYTNDEIFAKRNKEREENAQILSKRHGVVPETHLPTQLTTHQPLTKPTASSKLIVPSPHYKFIEAYKPYEVLYSFHQNALAEEFFNMSISSNHLGFFQQPEYNDSIMDDWKCDIDLMNLRTEMETKGLQFSSLDPQIEQIDNPVSLYDDIINPSYIPISIDKTQDVKVKFPFAIEHSIAHTKENPDLRLIETTPSRQHPDTILSTLIQSGRYHTSSTIQSQRLADVIDAISRESIRDFVCAGIVMNLKRNNRLMNLRLGHPELRQLIKSMDTIRFLTSKPSDSATLSYQSYTDQDGNDAENIICGPNGKDINVATLFLPKRTFPHTIHEKSSRLYQDSINYQTLPEAILLRQALHQLDLANQVKIGLSNRPLLSNGLFRGTNHYQGAEDRQELRVNPSVEIAKSLHPYLVAINDVIVVDNSDCESGIATVKTQSLSLQQKKGTTTKLSLFDEIFNTSSQNVPQFGIGSATNGRVHVVPQISIAKSTETANYSQMYTPIGSQSGRLQYVGGTVILAETLPVPKVNQDASPVESKSTRLDLMKKIMEPTPHYISKEESSLLNDSYKSIYPHLFDFWSTIFTSGNVTLLNYSSVPTCESIIQYNGAIALPYQSERSSPRQKLRVYSDFGGKDALSGLFNLFSLFRIFTLCHKHPLPISIHPSGGNLLTVVKKSRRVIVNPTLNLPKEPKYPLDLNHYVSENIHIHQDFHLEFNPYSHNNVEGQKGNSPSTLHPIYQLETMLTGYTSLLPPLFPNTFSTSLVAALFTIANGALRRLAMLHQLYEIPPNATQPLFYRYRNLQRLWQHTKPQKLNRLEYYTIWLCYNTLWYTDDNINRLKVQAQDENNNTILLKPGRYIDLSQFSEPYFVRLSNGRIELVTEYNVWWLYCLINMLKRESYLAVNLPYHNTNTDHIQSHSTMEQIAHMKLHYNLSLEPYIAASYVESHQTQQFLGYENIQFIRDVEEIINGIDIYEYITLRKDFEFGSKYDRYIDSLQAHEHDAAEFNNEEQDTEQDEKTSVQSKSQPYNPHFDTPLSKRSINRYSPIHTLAETFSAIDSSITSFEFDWLHRLNGSPHVYQEKKKKNCESEKDNETTDQSTKIEINNDHYLLPEVQFSSAVGSIYIEDHTADSSPSGRSPIHKSQFTPADLSSGMKYSNPFIHPDGLTSSPLHHEQQYTINNVLLDARISAPNVLRGMESFVEIENNNTTGSEGLVMLDDELMIPQLDPIPTALKPKAMSSTLPAPGPAGPPPQPVHITTNNSRVKYNIGKIEKEMIEEWEIEKSNPSGTPFGCGLLYFMIDCLPKPHLDDIITVLNGITIALDQVGDEHGDGDENIASVEGTNVSITNDKLINLQLIQHCYDLKVSTLPISSWKHSQYLPIFEVELRDAKDNKESLSDNNESLSQRFNQFWLQHGQDDSSFGPFSLLCSPDSPSSAHLHTQLHSFQLLEPVPLDIPFTPPQYHKDIMTLLSVQSEIKPTSTDSMTALDYIRQMNQLDGTDFNTNISTFGPNAMNFHKTNIDTITNNNDHSISTSMTIPTLGIATLIRALIRQVDVSILSAISRALQRSEQLHNIKTFYMVCSHVVHQVAMPNAKEDFKRCRAVLNSNPSIKQMLDQETSKNSPYYINPSTQFSYENQADSNGDCGFDILTKHYHYTLGFTDLLAITNTYHRAPDFIQEVLPYLE